jgi:hypothetical protein
MDKIVEKIKKLLALSRSDNEHEAATALAMAQELMVQYAVEESQLEEKTGVHEKIGTTRVGLDTKRVGHWEAGLAQVLAPAFFCRSFYMRGTDIFVVGRKSDCDVCIATFFFIRGEAVRLADRAWNNFDSHQRMLVNGKRWKNGYYEGLIRTIHERLTANLKRLSEDNKGTALMVVNRQLAVQNYMDNVVKPTSSRQTRAVETSGYQQGRRDGHAISLEGRATKSLKGA